MPCCSIAALERAAALHWAAADRTELDTWILRAAGGFTGRGNSVLALEPLQRLSLPEALDAAWAWYAARGLTPRLSAPCAEPGGQPSPESGGFDARRALVGTGWNLRSGDSGLVLTLEGEALRRAAGDRGWTHEPRAAVGGGAADRGVSIAHDPSQAWLAGYRYKGQDLPEVALPLLLSAPRQVFVSVGADGRNEEGGGRNEEGGGRNEEGGGRVAAIARVSLGPAPDDRAPGSLIGISAVEVHPAHRRQGFGARAVRAALSWALNECRADTTAPLAFLQVGDTNGAALALYRRLGFGVHHRYDYYSPSNALEPPRTS